MEKFTPGPWVLARGFKHKYVIPSEHSDRPVGGHTDPQLDWENYAQEVCHVGLSERHRSDAELMANAQLIAAAPEMLEALVNVRSVYRRGIVDCEPGEWAAAHDALNDVIAKATGSTDE